MIENNLFILLLVAGYDTRFWIGLNDINKEQAFTTWTSGNYVHYEAWAHGYPHEELGIEHCVTSKYEEWENHPCDDKHNFVCASKGKHPFDHMFEG